MSRRVKIAPSRGARRPAASHGAGSVSAPSRIRRTGLSTGPGRGGIPATPDEVYDTVLEVIGRTPLVRLHKVTRGIRADLVAKLEYLNPGGSVKDRIGPTMIEDAERRGLLRPGGTSGGAKSGNTGGGGAIAPAGRGYRTLFLMPAQKAQEKNPLLRALRARGINTPPPRAPPGPP